jgi:chaperonin GroES
MAKFRPLHDRLLVQRLDEESKTRGGIIIPDTAKEKPQQGRVLAVGPGRRDDKGELIQLDVRVGDKVMFAKYAGTEIKIDGEDRVILREEDILAVID